MQLTAPQIAWLGNGERGMSSDALFERLTGFAATRTPFRKAHPVDPDDFRRCHLMLEQCGLVNREERKQAFMDLMRAAFADLMEEIIGTRPSFPEAPKPAPEHERAGRA